MASAEPVLRVLGPVEVMGQDGTAVALGDRQRRLLAVLAAVDGEVSGDRLIDVVWDHGRGTTSALHTQLSRLRRAAAGAEAEIVTGAAGYALRVGDGGVDEPRFTSLVTRAEAVEPALAAELLAEALALWRGPAFGPIVAVPAVQPEAIRLDELRLVAVERRGRALVDADRADRAVVDLEPFVAEHPLREAALETLLVALYRTGRHREALERFQRYRAELADELGLEPSPVLRRLEAQILRHEIPAPIGAGTGTRSADDGQTTAPEPFDGLVVAYRTRPDGAAVATATVGDGPAVVAVPAWVTSLEITASGRDPRSSLLERLARRCRLTMYDRLGTGLSPGSVDDYSLEASVAELVTVLESAGPATLLAVSQSGPAAVVAAVRRPDLVTALALFGTFASAPVAFPDERSWRASLELLRANPALGARLIAGLYRPGASDAATEHLMAVMRESAPADVAAGYLETMYHTDVSDLLASVAQPAVVMHYPGDKVIPFRGGQHLAAGLPRATFVPLDGRYHLPDVADLDRIVDAIVELVHGLTSDGHEGLSTARHRPGAGARRVLFGLDGPAPEVGFEEPVSEAG